MNLALQLVCLGAGIALIVSGAAHGHTVCWVLGIVVTLVSLPYSLLLTYAMVTGRRRGRRA